MDHPLKKKNYASSPSGSHDLAATAHVVQSKSFYFKAANKEVKNPPAVIRGKAPPGSPAVFFLPHLACLLRAVWLTADNNLQKRDHIEREVK